MANGETGVEIPKSVISACEEKEDRQMLRVIVEESSEEGTLAASASQTRTVQVDAERIPVVVKAVEDESPSVVKKLPRVILKLGPREGPSGVGGAAT